MNDNENQPERLVNPKSETKDWVWIKHFWGMTATEATDDICEHLSNSNAQDRMMIYDLILLAIETCHDEFLVEPDAHKVSTQEEEKPTCPVCNVTITPTNHKICPLVEGASEIPEAPADNAQAVLQNARLLEVAQDAADWLLTARNDTQEYALGVELQVAITALAPSVVVGVEKKQDLGEPRGELAATHVLQNPLPPPWLPWYLDTCNEREILIKDSRGNVVHYEDLAFPDEWSGDRMLEVITEARENAMAMVRWSEAEAKS